MGKYRSLITLSGVGEQGTLIFPWNSEAYASEFHEDISVPCFKIIIFKKNWRWITISRNIYIDFWRVIKRVLWNIGWALDYIFKNYSGLENKLLGCAMVSFG